MPEASTLKSTPEISGNDIIAIVAGTTANTMPTSFTGAKYIQEYVNKMPQFFPEREELAYKVRASIAERSILGSRAKIDGAISLYYTKESLDAHLFMLQEQAKEAGCFWIVWYIANQDRTVAVRATCDTHLPTPEGESGEVDVTQLQITNKDEAIEVSGKQSGLGSLPA